MMPHSPCSQQASLHVVERRIVAALHKNFGGAPCPGVLNLDQLLSWTSGSALPLPGLLEVWQLNDLARLHNSSATLFRAEIKRALAAHSAPSNGPNKPAPTSPLPKPYDDKEMLMILDAADAGGDSWTLLHDLLSLQLFHLQRAAALTCELKLRQQQASQLKRSPSTPVLSSGGVTSRRNSGRFPRRSFELQLPAVYE